MKVIIMAGGEGTRLRPLTCDRPKPMVPIMNRPIMEHILNLLKKHCFDDIGVTLQYLPEAIQSYFEDGSSKGFKIYYFVEEVPLGTAGSVKNAESFLDDTFLVISGDALTDVDLSSAVEFHRQRQALATLVLVQVENPLEYGVVITDPEGRITQFLEKPSWGEVFSDRVNTGIYILEPEVLQLIKPGQSFDFSKDLFPLLLKKKLPLYGYVTAGYWCDVGNLSQYLQAHYDALEGRVELEIPGKSVGDNIWIGEGTQIHPEARLQGPLLIGENCLVGAGAEISALSVIGDNSVIEDQASIKRSITWANCRIGKKVQLRGATLAKRVQVRDNASIFEEAVVGDNTIIGRRCSLTPGTKVWPYKRVEDGTRLSSSLIWGSRNRRSLFGNRGITGLANVDITPELVSRIGGAYGNWLGSSPVGVGGDEFVISQALKEGVVAGLLSSGINVVNLGIISPPVFRYAIRCLELAGGIHLRVAADFPENVVINLFNSRGSEISRTDERKIENLLAREDIKYVEPDKVGTVSEAEDVTNQYLEQLQKSVNVSQIRKRKFKLVLSAPGAYLKALVLSLLSELGCDLNTIDYQPTTECHLVRNQKLVSYLKQMVVTQKCDLGVLLDHHAEKVVLIDETGKVVEDDLFIALVSLLVLSSNQSSAVVVPVDAPRVIEDLAERFSGRVIRSKTSYTAVLEKLESEGIQNNGTIDQFQLYSDGLAFLFFLLSYLAERRLTLSQLLKEIPDFYISKRVIECPWSAKGRVIRSLIEEHHQQPMELLEGVKVIHTHGWTLVLPDSEEPVCRIYSEGFSQEIAESLTDWYADRVRQISKTFGPVNPP